MIATCPACATRYVVDPAALGREGRTVRCAKCRNTWHQAAPEDALEEAEEAQRPPRYIPGMEVPPAASEPEQTPDEVEADSMDSAIERAANASGSVRASPRNLPAVRPSGRRQMLVAWGALLGALIIFLGILIGLRGPISESIPALAGLYDAVGLGDAPPATRPEEAMSPNDVLAFVSLGLKLEDEGGVPVLTVTGQIRNSTRQSLDLPPVRATLLDGDKQELYSWNFEPPAAQIGPETSLPFSSRLSNPPATVREAVLTFVSDNAATADMPGGE